MLRRFLSSVVLSRSSWTKLYLWHQSQGVCITRNRYYLDFSPGFWLMYPGVASLISATVINCPLAILLQKVTFSSFFIFIFIFVFLLFPPPTYKRIIVLSAATEIMRKKPSKARPVRKRWERQRDGINPREMDRLDFCSRPLFCYYY